jgi:hypothetical protein
VQSRTKPDAARFVPASESLPALRRAAAECRGCELYRAATQTVFGEGRAGAPLMLVGEQPGDKEDLAGHPFVWMNGSVCCISHGMRGEAKQLCPRAADEPGESLVCGSVKLGRRANDLLSKSIEKMLVFSLAGKFNQVKDYSRANFSDPYPVRPKLHRRRLTL